MLHLPSLRNALSVLVSPFTRLRQQPAAAEAVLTLPELFRTLPPPARSHPEKRTVILLVGNGAPAHIEHTVPDALALIQRALETNESVVIYAP